MTDIRNQWPQILEAVKGRRRVTWMLVQQAQVAGFDGSTLQLSFEHAGSRDGFVNGGHDEVLHLALQDALGVSWKVDCVVDPSGGGGGGAAGGGGGFGGGAGGGFGGRGPAAPAPSAPQAHGFAPAPTGAPSAPAPAPAPPAAAAPPAVQQPVTRPAAAPAPSLPDLPPPMPDSPDDEVPDEEDPAYAMGSISGQELIMRELGATVIEETDINR